MFLIFIALRRKHIMMFWEYLKMHRCKKSRRHIFRYPNNYSTSSVYDIFNKHPALTDLNKINPVKEMSERDLWKRRLTVGTFFFTTFAFTALLHFEKE
ncbi:hypothetical protein D917_06167 [Trichinella nativa]|uniref:Uncharacterized protein n=1 Tax=Trichinella nativa TaxID=6335 RepID=A0A1Y3EZC9_9BILA|nr:hypothetical protein D917_06167 [Trichinella nativa]